MVWTNEREHIMSNYQMMAKRQQKWMLYILAISVLLAGFMPNEQFFYGLLLGVAISFYNLWFLQRRTDLLGESAAKDGSRSRRGIGTIYRLTTAALGVTLAIRFDLNIAGYIIGLMTSYPVIMIDFILFNRKEG